jgi:hypothetical protein
MSPPIPIGKEKISAPAAIGPRFAGRTVRGLVTVWSYRDPKRSYKINIFLRKVCHLQHFDDFNRDLKIPIVAVLCWYSSARGSRFNSQTGEQLHLYE